MEKGEDGKSKNIVLIFSFFHLNVNQNMRNHYLQEYYHITTIILVWDFETHNYQSLKARRLGLISGIRKRKKKPDVDVREDYKLKKLKESEIIEKIS